MIEIIQQTEKNVEGKLPKNIRQIGNPEKDFRIYMEDYVYTYLHPIQFYAMGDVQPGMPYGIGEFLPRLLILVGEINHFSNRSCAFICGAIQVENSGFSEDLPELNEDAWRRIQKELQQYFGNSEVVGWALDIPGNELEVTKEMEEVHRKNFISPYQFFFLMDSKEREEAFYVFKSGHLTRKEGYFIYYEKNPGMQEYMICKRENICGNDQPSERIEDRAAKHYRAMMREKKERTYENGKGLLSYLSSLLMVIALCAVSVLLLGNIHRMEQMERTISVMSDALEATEEEKETDQVAVETISSSILPADAQTQNNAAPKESVNDAAAQENKGPEEKGEPFAEEETKGQGQADGEIAQDGSDAKEQTPESPAPFGEGDAPDGGQPAQEPQNPESPQTLPAENEPPKEAENYLSQGYYIVQKGDNLRGICYKIYHDYTMLAALCEVNAIEDQDYIWAGQKIILP